jgi:hypothetical protein
VRVGTWQLFPLVVEPLKAYAGAATGENAELLRHILRTHEATGHKGTWVLDRGFDRRELYGPLVKNAVAFVVRQRGDRTVRTADGREVTIAAVVAEQVCPCPKPWPSGGVSVTVEVWLPEVGPDPFLLVIGWRVPKSERPVVLLVSPAARRSGRTGMWFVRAYHKRWGVEDATRGLKQQFRVEQFLVWSSPSVVRPQNGLCYLESRHFLDANSLEVMAGRTDRLGGVAAAADDPTTCHRNPATPENAQRQGLTANPTLGELQKV